MSEQIPAQAVEAAARRLCVLAGYDWDNMDAPEDVVADFKAQLTEQAKSILDAAAPYMLAGAWQEGYMSAYDQERGGIGEGPIPVPDYLAEDLVRWNPYRK